MTGPVDAWLRELDEQLSVWGARRRDVLSELKDGLRCAAAEHRGRGLPPEEAEAAAAAEFGDPAALARDLAPELAASLSRTVALRLVGSGPVLGAVWLVALVASAPPVAHPSSLPVGLATVVLTAAPLLPAAIAGAVMSAGLALVATGPRARFFHLAPVAATATSAAVLVGDVMLLMTLAAQVEDVSPLLGLASTASAARIVVSLRCARCCLAVRAHLEP